MIALTFDILALEPLLITRLEGDPNSSVSYPYVPGGAVRGALASRYLPAPDYDLAGDPEARHLFFDGSTRYLNAYPLDQQGARSLPAPFSWFYEKGAQLEHGDQVYDLSRAAADLKQPKRVGERFFGHNDQGIEFTSPQWQISVHTAREREKGRAIEGEGAVFRYQALAAGQRLGAVIVSTVPEALTKVQELLEGGDLWLGGSRSGGYGRARVENVKPVDGWTEVEPVGQDLAAGDELVITLLSDAILRDATGAYSDSLTPNLLPVALNGHLRLKASFKRVVPVGGFNRKWGLPLIQAYALQAGSVFVFEVTGSIRAADLLGLVDQGIGERRAEGFGRLALNWRFHVPTLTIQKKEPNQDGEPKRDPPPPVSLSGQSRDVASRMVERLLRRDLDRRLAEYIYQIKLKDLPHWPSNAQLSRLRAVALNALPSADVGRLIEFLSKDKLKARARDQYQAARIENTRLLDWLGKRLNEPESIWKELASDGFETPQIGDVQAELTETLAREYTLRLVEGLMHRAEKERGND